MTQSPLLCHPFEEDHEGEERAGLIRSSIYSNPPMVVGAHYCNPNQETNLTLPLKVPFFKSDRLVDKPTGNTVFTIKRKALSLRNNFVLLNVAGIPVLCARSKLMSLHDQWEVCSGSHYDISRLLFTMKTSRLLQFRMSMNIFLASNSDQTQPDFKLKGNLSLEKLKVFHGEQLIAQVQRKSTFFGRITFVIKLFPGADQAFIITLALIIDQIIKQRTQAAAAAATT